MRFLASVFVFLFATASLAEASETAGAEFFFLRGKWQEAAGAYEKLVKEEPTLENLHRLAEAYVYSLDYSGARRAFKKALSIDGEDPYSIISLAMLRAVTGRNWKKKNKAMGELIALSNKYGEDARYWRALGFAYKQRNEDRKAIKSFREAVRRNPGDYMSYFFMGISYEVHLDFDGAMVPYKKAVEINPVFAQAVNNLGYNYKERHYYSYAGEMYGKAIELDPGHPGYYYNLGNVLNKWKMRRQAFYVHRKAVELEPKFAKAHYNVGKNLARFGFLKESRKHLKLYVKYWTSGLSERDVPPPKHVKEMIRDLDALIDDRKLLRAQEDKKEKMMEEKAGREARPQP
jgi:tetratricopeptide (TPR) repeat protein